MKGHERIRERILKILKVPISVSDLKNQLPDVSSFGTIAYHLKKLKKEGLIKKTKKKKERGKPTYYSLIGVEHPKEKIKETYDRMKKRLILKVLEKLKENPQKDSIFDTPDEELNDASMDAVGKGYSYLVHHITPKGLKFIKDNKS